MKLIKHIKKLAELPESGKPLKYELRNHMGARIPPFRITYRLEKDKLIINCFDHRKSVYG
ncbi:MAG: type II toxin-antitoxin system RelE/ParE family toxin [Nanoarchaeota archaeon]|nr:type II toxin-antitoxin system RelE/ParE family toxin [Nanoarchaeota archaeon]